MDTLPLTHGRAFQVTWGFLWRSSLTTLPLWFVTPLLTFWMVPVEAMTNPLALLQASTWLGFGSRFVLGTAVLLALSLYLMHLAMRWTLIATYRDFRLEAVPTGKARSVQQSGRPDV